LQLDNIADGSAANWLCLEINKGLKNLSVWYAWAKFDTFLCDK
jgi:hypothetical protein